LERGKGGEVLFLGECFLATLSTLIWRRGGEGKGIFLPPRKREGGKRLVSFLSNPEKGEKGGETKKLKGNRMS